MKRTPKASEREIFDRDSFVEHILGNVPIAKQIAKRALRDIEQSNLGLNDAIEEADLEKLHFHAHALKGVAYLVKCGQLASLAQEIDQLAKDQKLQEAIRRAPDLAPLIEETTQALNNFAGEE